MLRILLISVLALAGCTVEPRYSSVSLNGQLLMDEWRCSEPSAIQLAESPGPDGRPPSLASKLLQCPFARDYQLAAMQKQNSEPVSYEVLSEIVYKIRWGIYYQYGKFQEILRGQKRGKDAAIIAVLKFVSKPFLGAFGVIIHSDTEIENLGSATPLVLYQMQIDRKATGQEIDSRLASFKRGEKDYPLWQALIDLDIYFRSGTINNAMKNLRSSASATEELQQNM